MECLHSTATSVAKFCPDCGKPVNIVAREPGEIRAMVNRIPEIIRGSGAGDPATALMQTVVGLVAMGTLRWALGEVPTEVFERGLAKTREEAR